MNLLLKIIRFLLFDYRFLLNSKDLYVLMFHKVNDRDDVFYKGMPVKTFQQLINYVQRHFKIIHFDEIENELIDKKRKKPLLIITFDDGMKDIEEHVFPFLAEKNIKLTINIDTMILESGKPQYFVRVYDILNHKKGFDSYYDQKYMQNEISIQQNSLVEVEKKFTDLLSSMNNIQKEEFIQRMAENLEFKSEQLSGVLTKTWLAKNKHNSLIRFGSHSHTHPILDKISGEELEIELVKSKQILEKNLEKSITIFAYPNGISTLEIDQKIKEKGYTYILKTEDKINRSVSLRTFSFFRINQYHESSEIAILHTLGILNYLRKLMKFGN